MQTINFSLQIWFQVLLIVRSCHEIELCHNYWRKPCLYQYYACRFLLLNFLAYLWHEVTKFVSRVADEAAKAKAARADKELLNDSGVRLRPRLLVPSSALSDLSSENSNVVLTWCIIICLSWRWWIQGTHWWRLQIALEKSSDNIIPRCWTKK